MHDDDPLLIRHINARTFRKLYDCYAKKLYRLGCHYLGDPEEAREIVHDIFKSLWERRATFTFSMPPDHYLVRAAKLQICRQLRDKTLHRTHLEHVSQTCSFAENSTEDLLRFNQLTQQVETCLDTLPLMTRRIFRLSREQGLPNKTIAGVLGVSEKTVEYHITKSIALLRRELEY